MLEQVFSDNYRKISPKSTEQELAKILREAFPLIQKDAKVTNYVECFDELTRLANYSEYNPNIIQASKARQTLELLSTKQVSKNDKPDNLAEIVKYKNTITSLESEIAHYKAKVDSMQTQIVQFQHVTRGLRVQIPRLVNNLSMFLENDRLETG